MDLKKFKFTQADKQRLLQLMREEETRFDTSDDSLDLGEEEISNFLKDRFDVKKSVVQSQELDEKSMDEGWKKLSARINRERSSQKKTENVISSSATNGGPSSVTQLDPSRRNRKNFRLHISSYIAAAAVLSLVIVNSPLWQEGQVGQSQKDQTFQVLTKGNNSLQSSFEGCSVGLLQGYGDELIAQEYSAIEPSSISLQQGEYRVSVRCDARLGQSDDPTIYAHFFVNSSADGSSRVVNVPMILNTTHVVSNPEDLQIFVSKVPDEADDATQRLIIAVSPHQLSQEIRLEDLDKLINDEESQGTILDVYELTLRADYDRLDDNQ